MTWVDSKISAAIGVLTLNNLKKLSPPSRELIDDLCAALKDMQQHEVRVVILRAPQGSKVFSVGHDIRELPTNGRDPLTYNDPLRHVVRAIEHFPAPVIAMIEGSVWGGACELVRRVSITLIALWGGGVSCEGISGHP